MSTRPGEVHLRLDEALVPKHERGEGRTAGFHLAGVRRIAQVHDETFVIEHIELALASLFKHDRPTPPVRLEGRRTTDAMMKLIVFLLTGSVVGIVGVYFSSTGQWRDRH